MPDQSSVGRETTPDLVALSTPMPGAPDVSRATDERVFDRAALRDLHDALDRIDRLGIYRRQR
jgi:hypothetical protein